MLHLSPFGPLGPSSPGKPCWPGEPSKPVSPFCPFKNIGLGSRAGSPLSPKINIYQTELNVNQD